MASAKVRTLVLMSVNQCGRESIENVMSVIEEELTVKEAEDVRKFLTWAFFDWKMRGFGHGNFETRWNKWHGTLTGKKPYEGKDVKKLITRGQKLESAMQDHYQKSQRYKELLKNFLEGTGITRGQLKRGY